MQKNGVNEMKHVNQLIKAKQAELDNKQLTPESKSTELSADYIKIMLDLFEALGRLFLGKCKLADLEIHDEKGNYTDMFETWCRKLFEAGITKADMRRGMAHLEEAERDAVRVGGELYAPSYAAFIEHCRVQKDRHKLYQRLPAPTISNEEKKERMKALRQEQGL